MHFSSLVLSPYFISCFLGSSFFKLDIVEVLRTDAASADVFGLLKVEEVFSLYVMVMVSERKGLWDETGRQCAVWIAIRAVVGEASLIAR